MASCVACSSGMTPDDPAATPIVIPQNIPAIELVAEQEYGEPESGYEFSSVNVLDLPGRRVELDEGGNLYVLDPLLHSVVVIAPDGRFLRRIGGEGDGPGELRSPRMIAYHDGTVFVGDSNGRLTEFSVSGETRRVSNLGDLMAYGYEMSATLEHLIVWSIPTQFSEKQWSRDSVFVHVVDRATNGIGAPIVRLPLPPMFKESGGLGVSMRVGSWNPHIYLAPDGRTYSTQGLPFTITVTAGSGKVVGQGNAVVPRVRVSDIDVDRRYSDLVRFVGVFGEGLEPPPRSRYKPKKEKYRSPIGHLVADGAGNLVVERTDLYGHDVGQPATWDYVTPDWHVAGRFTAPRDLRPKLLRGCNLYAIRQDDLDVQTVVRYRMEPCPN